MTKQSFNLFNLIKWTKQNIELLFWFTAIIMLFFLNVTDTQTSLCVFRRIGIDHCPGCGLGHSIHHALHGRVAQSFHEHIMGIPGLIIIFHRITQLIYPKKITIYEK